MLMMRLIFYVAASATDAVIQKKNRSSRTALITSKEEMEDIVSMIKSLEESCLFVKVASETI